MINLSPGGHAVGSVAASEGVAGGGPTLVLLRRRPRRGSSTSPVCPVSGMPRAAPERRRAGVALLERVFGREPGSRGAAIGEAPGQRGGLGHHRRSRPRSATCSPRSRRSRRAAPTCASSARAAPARSSSRAPSTTTATGAIGPSSPSTARPFPRGSWRATSSDTCAARSPAPSRTATASSRSPTPAPCSSTRSASCRSPLQAKLLRVIQTREFVKVGGSKPIRTDIRLITASNKDLRRAVADGTFREDLYYRIAVVMLQTPPLRERKGDIPLLVDHFLREVQRGPPQAHPRGDARGHGAAHELSVAGQHPPARELHRAGGGPLRGRPGRRGRAVAGRHGGGAPDGFVHPHPLGPRRSATSSSSTSCVPCRRPGATGPALRGCSASASGACSTSSRHTRRPASRLPLNPIGPASPSTC